MACYATSKSRDRLINRRREIYDRIGIWFVNTGCLLQVVHQLVHDLGCHLKE